MSFQATVYRVLIASPSDVSEERKAIQEAMHLWNTQNSEMFNIIFMPTMWETNSVPEMGARPQAKLNDQIVDKSDLLIGIFWTRLGTSTGIAESGTLEEIQRFIEGSKKVMIYFSNRPVSPQLYEPTQFMKLQEFKQECLSKGLLGDFTTEDELKRKITELLMKLAREAETRILPPDTRNKHREPQLEISLNDSVERLSLTRPGTFFTKEQHGFIVYDEIDEYLQKYITAEDVEQYNENIPEEEHVDRYNESLEVYNRVQNGRLNLKVSISNVGTLKANNIFCTMRFPSELLVIEKDTHEDWEKPSKPDFPVNPLVRAMEKYHKDLREKLLPTYGILANLRSFDHLTTNLYRDVKYTRLLPAAHSNWRLNVAENAVTIQVNSLLHTKRYTFDEEIEVIPLQLGEFPIEIEMICEEMEIPIRCSFPISVVNAN